jgi:hypothetical protein
MNVYQLFTELYIVGPKALQSSSMDAHSIFAEKLKVPRNEAKIICYDILYNSEFVQNYMLNVFEGAVDMYKEKRNDNTTN